jgi:F-type H+-transporting ATPase subunit delta
VAVAQRIYAQALFDAAKEQDALQTVRDELEDFVATLETVPELDAVLRNPQLHPQAKVALLEDLLGGTNALVRNFLLLVVEKGRAHEIAGMQREFEDLWRREQGILNVELTTAFELEPDERSSIIEQIRSASGRQVQATSSVDPGLIGGLVIQAGSRRVDASVRGRLERLRHELTSSALRDY